MALPRVASRAHRHPTGEISSTRVAAFGLAWDDSFTGISTSDQRGNVGNHELGLGQRWLVAALAFGLEDGADVLVVANRTVWATFICHSNVAEDE